MIFKESSAQLEIRTEKDFTKLVNNVLVSSGVTIRNVIFRGDTSAIGIFNAQNTNLGIDSGIIISTGNVYNAIGPSSNNANTVASGTGDGDLNSILTQGITKDAASLQFEFSPASNTVKFKIVFASEEYPEFVDEPFNDVFGIF
ncbi:MAG: choice-of-anchor L domain-containing protein, partial [bacterium]